MTEILKITKISLLLYGIVCALYGVTLLFFPSSMEATLGTMDAYEPRLFGGVLLVIAIFAFLIILNKNWDWESVKLAHVVLYSMILSTLLIEGAVTAALLPTLSASAVGVHVTDVILMLLLLILGIVSYMKQKV